LPEFQSRVSEKSFHVLKSRVEVIGVR
jgi:hypothetical protein